MCEVCGQQQLEYIYFCAELYCYMWYFWGNFVKILLLQQLLQIKVDHSIRNLRYCRCMQSGFWWLLMYALATYCHSDYYGEYEDYL